MKGCILSYFGESKGSLDCEIEIVLSSFPNNIDEDLY